MGRFGIHNEVLDGMKVGGVKNEPTQDFGWRE